MMNGKVRAFNGDMGMAMSVFKDMVGKVRFVFADPPYKITQARYDKEGFDYKAMWEVIQKMLCPYGVVAVTCSLTAAVEIMRVAPAGWYRYDLVWHNSILLAFRNFLNIFDTLFDISIFDLTGTNTSILSIIQLSYPVTTLLPTDSIYQA